MRSLKKTAREISPEKLKDLKANAVGILADTRRSLLNDYPFTGSVIMSLDIIPVRDIRLPTAACDGKHIFFDIDFLASLSADERKFVLAHECWHALMNHMVRGKGFEDHELMNIAMDLEINQMLAADGLACPASACMPQKFEVDSGLSAEEYYRILSKNPDIMPFSSSSARDSDVESQYNDPNTSGNKLGKLDGQFDKHLRQNEAAAQVDNGTELCDKWGKLGLDPEYSPSLSESEVKKSVERMREAAVSAAQTYERTRGELPRHLAGFVSKITRAEIPWQEKLASFITRTIGSETCWTRPNRRFVHSGTYLPSRTSESINLGVIIDTSGSTSADIPKFLGEVNGIVKTFSGYSLTILQVDTQVQSVETYGEDRPLELETQKFETKGGGGTTINPGIQWFRDNSDDTPVDALCIFTDGYTENFTKDMDPGIPVIWVITKDGQTSNKEFGEICVFKRDANED